MFNSLQRFITVVVLGSLLLSACGLGGLGGKEVKVSIVYGSEKREWLEPLVDEFNQAKVKTARGETIQVEITPMGSIESVEAILSGAIQPVVWSPASDVYLPVANAEWRKTHAADLVEGSPRYLVLSPVVIAMWKPMAETLGWPDQPIGWSDISQLAVSEEGWLAYGYPEWGGFKFGHTHPNYSNSGIVALIAQAYAAAGKPRGLTVQDIQDPATKDFIADVQSSIIHYGTSTGFFAERMFERGPSYLSAAVLYENLIVAQEAKRLAGASSQLPVVAIYPKEGTFWANHPYAVLNAPWVTPEQKEAAQIFESFLLDQAQQTRAIQLGFRPADPSIPLGPPLDAQHGVDIAQPQTVLEVPSAEVISGLQEVWREVKKPVDVTLVIDTSGSMRGDKIAAARQSLIAFVELLDDRDRVQVITFNSDILTLTDLSLLGEKRQDVTRRVSGLVEGGGTRLYDATALAYEEILAKGDDDHIRAVLVLSDGSDNESISSLEQLMETLGAGAEEGGNAVKLFTIAFGENANEGILRQMAEATGGRVYKGDPTNIQKIYSEIATFF
jgi:Ca-activated chloride channel family protein